MISASAVSANSPVMRRKSIMRGSVRVPVVCVWEMWMGVSQGIMPVAMGMADSPGAVCVGVLVVRIMFVIVLVVQGLVRMLVAMVFGQVQPDAQGHQCAGHQQDRRDGLPQPDHRQHGAEERGHR